MIMHGVFIRHVFDMQLRGVAFVREMLIKLLIVENVKDFIHRDVVMSCLLLSAMVLSWCPAFKDRLGLWNIHGFRDIDRLGLWNIHGFRCIDRLICWNERGLRCIVLGAAAAAAASS